MHDDLAEHLLLRAGLAIEVLDALREALVVDEHASGDGVGPDLELAGLQRVRQQVVGRAEERGRVAATPALAAVVARREAAHRLGHVGAPAADERDADLRARAPHRDFGAAHLRRRQEVLAARQHLRVVVAATHADQLIDLVVVRRDVAVMDGPRDVPAIALAGAEVHLAVAQADAAPDVGLAADAPDAIQLEVLALRREVGLLLRVEEELGRPLAARPPRPVFPRRHVRPELRPVELLAGVQQQHVHALARQVPRRHAARGTGSDDDDGVDLRGRGICMATSDERRTLNAERSKPDA